MGGGFGVDLGGLPLDTPLGDLETEGSQGHLTAIRASVRGGNPTLRDIALYRSRANRVVGTPEQIADRLEQWQDAGIDGINIINQTIPGSYTDFIDGVLPELRSRGLAQPDYAPGTLREKLFGAGDHGPRSTTGTRPRLPRRLHRKLSHRRAGAEHPGERPMSDELKTAAPSAEAAYERLAERFRPVFARIAEGALAREQDGSCPLNRSAG